MNYRSSESFAHGQAPRIGVLLTNLGTPDAPTKAALKPYLRQFLWDPRVVEVPRLLWWLILHGIILRVRPRRSAEAYASVWSAQGSPLMVHTRAQAEALQTQLAQQFGTAVVVDFAMRYGTPSISDRMEAMFDQGVRKLLILPLYPQYAGPTTGSTFDAVAADLMARRWLPDLRFISQYHDYPPYIDALAAQIQQHWDHHGRADRLVFSYHGEPLRYLTDGDPYHCQCHKTSRLVAQRLGLEKDAYLTTFQSRFGREEWLKPYTDETLQQLPQQGVRAVQVVCPGFAADCLETIEEIGVENRDYFMEAGGERYEYISALNSEPHHIAALAQLVTSNLSGWTLEDDQDALQQSQARALAMGSQR